MPSSSSVGARPSRRTISWYSSAVSAISSKSGGRLSTDEGLDDGFEEKPAIGPAQLNLRRALGVRHQSEHVAARVDEAGDVPGRAVRVLPIPEHDVLVGPKVPALTVGDRHAY